MNEKGKSQRKLHCFIAEFKSYLEGLPTPDIFKEWSAVSCLAGLLGRKVWVQAGSGYMLYPNMYIGLIAPPGVGKSTSIREVSKIWLALGDNIVKVGPDDVTRASLIDAMADARTEVRLPNGKIMHNHSLNVASSELQNLIPEHNEHAYNLYNQLFDCEAEYKERRRAREEQELIITNPQLNMLGGTQPYILGRLMPHSAFEAGFPSRWILVASYNPTPIDFFPADDKEAERLVMRRIKKLQELVREARVIASYLGNVKVDMEVRKFVNGVNSGDKPDFMPQDSSKLSGYRNRRAAHLIKLATIIAVSKADFDYVIEMKHLEEAYKMLLKVEEKLPNLVSDIHQDQDRLIIEEAWSLVWKIFRDGGAVVPISKHHIIDFLSTKVGATKVSHLFRAMEDSYMIRKAPKDAIPKGKNNLPSMLGQIYDHYYPVVKQKKQVD